MEVAPLEVAPLEVSTVEAAADEAVESVVVGVADPVLLAVDTEATLEGSAEALLLILDVTGWEEV